MLPIADGSDAGGSLRNPPAFCNVVGLRPSPGRVTGRVTSWSPLSVSGPIARTVADVALVSQRASPAPFRATRSRSRTRRARYRGPLGQGLQGRACGLVARPRRHSLRAGDTHGVVDANRKVFEDLGCVVEEAEPDFTGVDGGVPGAAVRRKLPAATRRSSGSDPSG